VKMVVCLRLINLSSVGWYCVVGRVGVLCGIVHEAGKAILMRGGACAAELRLMGLGVGSFCVSGCVFVLLSFVCYVSCCFWGFLCDDVFFWS
jgi:hypothetical protein